jgi:4-alpha-glucanotransferase
MWEDALNSDDAAAQQARFDLEKIATFADFKRTSDQIDFERDFYPSVLRALFKTESWIAMVMITDLLARKYRFNVPGTAASSNWTRRMQRTISQLRSSPKERKRMQLIREMLRETGRL